MLFVVRGELLGLNVAKESLGSRKLCRPCCYCYYKMQSYGYTYSTHFSNRFALVILFQIKFETNLTCLVTITVGCFVSITLVPCFGKVIIK